MHVYYLPSTLVFYVGMTVGRSKVLSIVLDAVTLTLTLRIIFPGSGCSLFAPTVPEVRPAGGGGGAGAGVRGRSPRERSPVLWHRGNPPGLF